MSKRTILITGATGKLGRSLVAHFLSCGDTVVAVARTRESLDGLSRQHADAEGRFAGIEADLIVPGAIEVVVRQVLSRPSAPDCLINAARSVAFLANEADGRVSRQNFANELLLDVIVPYELTMALVADERSALRRVVNVGSQYGTVAANPHLYASPATSSPLHYSVAKAALAHLTRELAVRLAPKDIQVNCVAFGGVEGRVDEQFKQRYARLCPLGRMLRDDEIAGPVDMLLSDSSSGITGHVLAVDGGWSIW
jgi:NAD(P)-dependent dehydrogenase (short-subunit alcohol dehydrogenase family)